MRKTFLMVLGALALMSSSNAICVEAAVCPRAPGVGKIGVVLMHCKDGEPDKFIDGVASALSRHGYLVVTPEMAWSHQRRYDMSFDQAVDGIDRYVKQLRARGAERIVIAGHSLCANAALRYGAIREHLAGIAMLGPGQSPEWTLGKMVASSLARAQAMVAEGRGDEVATFDDSNQGARISIRAKAKDYVSYFDPHGSAVMSENASHLKPGTPLLFVVGTRDRFYDYYTKAYAIDRAPANPMNRFIVVNSDHHGTPGRSISEFLSWLQCL